MKHFLSDDLCGLVCGSRCFDFSNTEGLQDVWKNSAVWKLLRVIKEHLLRAADCSGNDVENIFPTKTLVIPCLVAAFSNRSGKKGEVHMIYDAQRTRKRAKRDGKRWAFEINIPDPFHIHQQQHVSAVVTKAKCNKSPSDTFYSRSIRLNVRNDKEVSLKRVVLFKCIWMLTQAAPPKVLDVEALIETTRTSQIGNQDTNVFDFFLIGKESKEALSRCVREWRETAQDMNQFLVSFNLNAETKNLSTIMRKAKDGASKFNQMKRLLCEGISSELMELLSQLHNALAERQPGGLSAKVIIHQKLEEMCPPPPETHCEPHVWSPTLVTQ